MNEMENYEVFSLDGLEDTDCSDYVNDEIVFDSTEERATLQFTAQAENTSLADFAEVAMLDEETTFDSFVTMETDLTGDILCELDTETDNVMLNTSESQNLMSENIETSEELVVDDTDAVDDVIEADDTGVVFQKGMTIVEFLRANPTVRTKEKLCEYFTADNVNRAIRNGAIMCMHDKLYL